MKYLGIYENFVSNSSKKYFIDCENINDLDETVYFWKFIEYRYKDFGGKRVIVEKLYSLSYDEVTDFCTVEHGDTNFYRSGDDTPAFELLPNSIFIVFESDNFDEVYDYFMMIVDSRKYNL